MAALGFEPTDGAPAKADGAARSVFGTTTADVLDSPSPPKGTLFVTEPGANGDGDTTAESPRLDDVAPADARDRAPVSDIEAPVDEPRIVDEQSVLEDLDSALDDLYPDDDGQTVVAETGAGDTIRVPSPNELLDGDSSGVHPADVPPSPVPGRPLDEQANGFAADRESDVRTPPGPTADDAGVLGSAGPMNDGFAEVLSPPVAEHSLIPQQIPVPGSPLTVDEALGGAVVGETIAARQANGATQSIGGRVSGAASRLPHLLEEGFRQRPRRVRARKVRRVVRHIDPWSMLTFSVLFHLCLFAALLLASVLVWNAAMAAGTIENIEDFIRDLGDYKTYEINGDVVFRAAMVIAGILTLASSLLVVLLTVVFNLISDLVGGIRVTVVEEETVRVRRRSNQ